MPGDISDGIIINHRPHTIHVHTSIAIRDDCRRRPADGGSPPRTSINGRSFAIIPSLPARCHRDKSPVSARLDNIAGAGGLTVHLRQTLIVTHPSRREKETAARAVELVAPESCCDFDRRVSERQPVNGRGTTLYIVGIPTR